MSISSGRPIRRIPHAFVLAAYLLGYTLGCGVPQDEQILAQVVPSLRPADRRGLLSSNREDLLAWARDAGTYELANLEDRLRSAYLETATDVPSGAPADPSYDRSSSSAVVRGCLDRLARAQAEVYGDEGARASFRSLCGASPEDLRLIDRLLQERGECLEPLTSDPDASLARLDTIASRFDSIGVHDESARTLIERARLSRSSPSRALAAGRRSLVAARRSGRPELICLALGDLALHHASSARADSLHLYMREALGTAIRHRLPVRAATLSYVYSHYFHRHGREGLAAELREAAVEYCRDFRGGTEELEFLARAMSIHSAYGNWDLVDRDLRRARQVLALAEESKRWKSIEGEFTFYEAQVLMANHDVERAEALYRSLTPTVALLDSWGKWLLENERPRRAREVIERGRRMIRETDSSLYANRFQLLDAEALVQLEEYAAADSILGLFGTENAPGGDPWIDFHVALLRARVFGVRGELVRARRALGEAEAQLRGAQSRDASGADMHVSRVAAADLREEKQHLARGNEEATYRAFFDEERQAGRVREWTLGRGHVHILYEERRGAVVRWTASSGGLICDTLDVTPEVLSDQVWAARERLVHDPGDPNLPPDPELVSLLLGLGDLLVPAELRRGGPGSVDPHDSMVLITARGVLRLLPFEVLGVSAAGYEPLLAHHDIAYLRGARATGAFRRSQSTRESSPTSLAVVTDSLAPFGGDPRNEYSGGGLILASPDLPAQMRRRYPGLGDLAGGRREAEHLSRLSPHSRFLLGSGATLSRIQADWERSDFLYFATHMVREPENPLWTFLPVAAGDSLAGPDASRLEIVDILGARLDSCQLVVLSGCGSGVPYVTNQGEAPSLADAFLDAGAHAVVQTFWKVRDEDATRLMERFQELWIGDGEPPVRALAHARRSSWSDGMGHPFYWASYGIQLRQP